MEQKILNALDSGPRHKSELANVAGMDGLRTMGGLKSMRERGLIALTFDGRYERASGGYA